MSITFEISQLFARRGNSPYGGELVTQQEHALQCALLAQQSGASSDQIVAALLHDIGHLLHDLPADAPEQGIDDRHENRGNKFLQREFPQSVSEPVQLHVDAKRYLCAVEADYHSSLSQPSVHSLQLQGGPMSAEDVNQFEGLSYWQEAVALRRWDDQAKQTSFLTPSLEHFLPLVAELARPRD